MRIRQAIGARNWRKNAVEIVLDQIIRHRSFPPRKDAPQTGMIFFEG
jgi:hypothetical protein